MNNTLEQVEARLAYDSGSPITDWEIVEELFTEFPLDREMIARWLFEQHNGYVDTRTRAGLEFMRSYPDEGWRILERLLVSTDPDDRDTALAVLEALDSNEAACLALALLDDEFPYIALEAAAFVQRFQPAATADGLTRLLKSESSSVREQARKLLAATRPDSLASEE